MSWASGRLTEFSRESDYGGGVVAIPKFANTALLAFELDGILTDGTTWWGGPEVGWVQRYNVRDGMALLRLAERIEVVPLTRNDTVCARERITSLGLTSRWLGASDKLVAIREIATTYRLDPERICFVGDGADDALVFPHVGIGCSVADAHPLALRASHIVLHSRGGERVIEELEQRLRG